MHKWFKLFDEGGSDIHDESRSSRPTIITEDLTIIIFVN